MKKILILIISILLLCGCNQKGECNKSFEIYVDEETCFEYFIINNGDIKPRYAGTNDKIKRNSECINKKIQESRRLN